MRNSTTDASRNLWDIRPRKSSVPPFLLSLSHVPLFLCTGLSVSVEAEVPTNESTRNKNPRFHDNRVGERRTDIATIMQVYYEDAQQTPTGTIASVLDVRLHLKGSADHMSYHIGVTWGLKIGRVGRGESGSRELATRYW
jgi:hypothetical protein